MLIFFIFFGGGGVRLLGVLLRPARGVPLLGTFTCSRHAPLLGEGGGSVVWVAASLLTVGRPPSLPSPGAAGTGLPPPWATL